MPARTTVNIARVLDTLADLVSSLSDQQWAQASDNTFPLVVRNDTTFYLYQPSQSTTDGVNFTYLDVTFGDVSIDEWVQSTINPLTRIGFDDRGTSETRQGDRLSFWVNELEYCWMREVGTGPRHEIRFNPQSTALVYTTVFGNNFTLLQCDPTTNRVGIGQYEPLYLLHIQSKSDVDCEVCMTAGTAKNSILRMQANAGASTDRWRWTAQSSTVEAAMILNLHNDVVFEINKNIVTIYGDEATDATLILAADQSDDTTDDWSFISKATGNDLRILNGSTELFFIGSTGKVGIGGAQDVTAFLKAYGGGIITGNLTVGSSTFDATNTLAVTGDAVLSRAAGSADCFLQIIGANDKNAYILLYADRGDDSLDRYTILASTSDGYIHIKQYSFDCLLLNYQHTISYMDDFTFGGRQTTLTIYLYPDLGGTAGSNYSITTGGGNLNIINNVTTIATISSTGINIVGQMECDTLRIDVAAIAASITPDNHFLISLNGTSYKVPCLAA